MKKYFVLIILVSLFITTAFTLGTFTKTASATTAPMTVSQLVELLINIGVIAPDKAVAARTAVASLSTVPASSAVSAITGSSSLPYLQILSPNGGESWDLAVTLPYYINWGSNKAVPVSLGLVAGTKVCNLTPTPVNSSVGNNSYKIYLSSARCYGVNGSTSTPVVNGSYKARVSYVSSGNVTVRDDGDNNLTIKAVAIPSIKLNYPNGGEKLVTGSKYDLKYAVSNTTERGLKFSFINDEGNSMYSVTVFGSHGLYNLRLPSSLTDGAYKLKIQMTLPNGTVIEDTSDNFFWVSHS